MLLLLGFASLCVASPAFAQDEPESTTTQVFHWLNFTLIIVGIGYGVKKAAPAFRRNAESISEAIAEGARARAEAERRRKEAEAKLAGLPADIEAMRAEAKKDSLAEIERIRGMAKEDAERIHRSAEAEIQAAERAARMELRTLAADLVIARATTLVQQQMTPEADSGIFRNFLQELDRSVS